MTSARCLAVLSSAGVKLVMEAICVMKDVKATRLKDPQTGKFYLDFWESSKKVLADPKVRTQTPPRMCLTALREYDVPGQT